MAKQMRWIGMFIIVLIFVAIACQACSRITGDEEVSNQSSISSISGESSTSEEAKDASSADTLSGSSEGSSSAGQTTEDEAEKEEVQEEEGQAALEPTLAPTEEPTAEPEEESGESSSEGASEGSDSGEEEAADEDSSSDGGDSSSSSDSDSSSSVSAGGAGETACDHPYLPLRLGATWTYNNDGETLTWEVVDVQGDQSDATAVIRITSSQITIDTNWICSSEDGLTSHNFADFGFGDLGADMTIEQTNAEGVFLPPANELTPGAAWDMITENTINYTQDAGGETIAVTGSMVNTQSNEVVSTESIEFEGQTINGIQIDQGSTIDMVITVLGNSVNQTVAVSNSYNLGEGIGLINQTSVTDFGPSTMQLVSYSIP